MKAALRLLLLLGVAAHADEGAGPWQVRVDLQIVQMPLAGALALVPRINDEKSAGAAYAEVQAGIAAGEYKLASDLSAQAPADSSHGNGVATEAREEVRYPHEFRLEDPRFGPSRQAAARAKEPAATGYPVRLFEMREIGASLEFQSVVWAGGRLVYMTCAPRVTEFKGWTRFETARRQDGLMIYAPQPSFETRRTETSFVCRPGVPLVQAVYLLPGSESRVELHLVTARVRNLAGFPGLAEAPAPKDAQAAEPIEPHSWQMRAEFHAFRLAQKDALVLRAQLLDEARAGEAFARLLKMAVGGQARLVQWQNWPIAPLARGASENIRELRYPGELDLGGPPRSFDGSPYPRFEEDSSLDPPNSIYTRNLGGSGEIEPRLGEGGTKIPLNFSFQSVEQDGFTRWTLPPYFDGRFLFQYKPKTLARKVSCNTTVKNGVPALVQFARLPDGVAEKGREFEIVTLRVSARDLLAQ